MYIRDKNIMGEFEFASSSSANKHYKGSEISHLSDDISVL
jgi:hypothetical protein